MKPDYFQFGRDCFNNNIDFYHTQEFQDVINDVHHHAQSVERQKLITDGWVSAQEEFFQPYVNEFTKELKLLETKHNVSSDPHYSGYEINVDGRRYSWY